MSVALLIRWPQQGEQVSAADQGHSTDPNRFYDPVFDEAPEKGSGNPKDLRSFIDSVGKSVCVRIHEKSLRECA